MTRRVSALDRPWLDTYLSTLVGPVHMPPRSAIVDAIVELAQAFPHSRLGWQLDDDRKRWMSPGASLREQAEQMVVAVEDAPDDDYSAFLTRFGVRRDLAFPAAFVVAPRHLCLRLSHGVGDGRSVTMLLSGVLQQATTGELPDWGARPGVAHPYRKALSAFFGRSPRRVARAVRAARPAASGPAPAGIPWLPDPVTVYRCLPASGLDEVRRWRSKHARGVSMPALELMLLLRAFEAVDMPISPDVLTLFDARRYLPREKVDGNFVVGLLLPVAAGNSVAEIAASMTRAAESGRPLTAMAASLLNSRRSHVPATAPASPVAQLAFSHIGRPPSLERLRFLPDATPVYCGSLDPASPAGVTVATTQTGGSLHLSATLHANVLDPGLVDAALALISRDPLALLDRRHASELVLPARSEIALHVAGGVQP
jgi:hypothetical protein